MKGANKVLAMGRVDTGLAADRAVDLGQQAGGQLHETHTAPQDRGGKAGQIADHPATEGQHHILAFDLLLQQPFDTSGQLRPAFGALARRQHQRFHRDALGGQPVAQAVQMQGGHVLIGNHGHARAAQQRRDQFPRPGQQIRAHMHVIGAIPKGHMDDFTCHGASSTSGRVSSASTT